MSQAAPVTDLQQAAPGYAQSRMIWFKRTGPLTQALFTLPLIGFITGQQAIIIVAFGLPILFGVLNATGDVLAAVLPFLVIVVFALIRPPVMSYEARLFTLLRFHVMGGPVKAGKKRRKKGAAAARRSRFLSRPGTGPRKPKKGAAAEAEAAAADDEDEEARPSPAETETMEVGTYPGLPVDIAITLRDRADHILSRRRVGILLDGSMLRTAVSSTSGQIPVLIDPEEAVGTRRLAICEISHDGSPASAIIEKRIAFVPMTRGGR